MNRTQKFIVLTFILIFMVTFLWNEKYGNSKTSPANPYVKLQGELTEEKKQQIYQDMIIAESRAVTENQLKYPSDPNTGRDDISKLGEKIDHLNKLTEKYKKNVLLNHNISEEQWEKIANEAVEESWEIPQR